MYGTVMIGRSSASVDDWRSMMDEWRRDIGDAAGFVDERVLVGDDGRIVMVVRFRDEAAYKALSDDPAQDAWWSERIAPTLEGEPEWIDGHWHDL
jgi:hypothetical protein